MVCILSETFKSISGQIEGGFMQGYGLFTLEEMVYSPTGIVFSRGPGNI